MKKIVCLFLLVLIISNCFPADINNGIIAHFPLKGNLKEYSGKTLPVKMRSPKFVSDKEGNSNSALLITKSSVLSIPVDLNPAKYPKLSISFWVKTENMRGLQKFVNSGDEKKCRGFLTDNSGSDWFWSVNCGKDGILNGSPVTGNWTFLAVLYDQENQEVRFIVNDRVYAGRGLMGSCRDVLSFTNFDGVINNIKIYNRLLSLEELETLYEGKITNNIEELTIKERYQYRKNRHKKDLESILPNTKRVVSSDNLNIYDTLKAGTVTDFLVEGDTLRILEVSDKWTKILYKESKEGFVRSGSLPEGTFGENESGFWHSVKTTFKNTFNIGKTKSWIIFGILLVLLFLAYKFYFRIDSLFIKMGNRVDVNASGSISEGVEVPLRVKLAKLFPQKKFHRWPIMIGVTAAMLLIIGSFWDGYEMEWFFNEGFNILPMGYDRAIHWFLYLTTIFIFFLIIGVILESYAIAGIAGGALRFFYLLIVNFMALVVTFFLFIVIAVILLALLGLSLFGAAASGSNYRCSYCGRVYSGSSSSRCPGCGR